MRLQCGSGFRSETLIGIHTLKYGTHLKEEPRVDVMLFHQDMLSG
jgi:hypothetical protein